MNRHYLMLAIIFSILCACRQNNTSETTVDTSPNIETKQNLSPDIRYSDLFQQVQLQRIFPDGKTFTDMTPKYLTDEILEKYQMAKTTADFDLKTFIMDNFSLPKDYASGFKSDTSKTAAQHINSLWDILERAPDSLSVGTLIPLPNTYIVPGGRFGEVYYWDSYFTMLGLQTAGKVEMIQNMVDNFSYLIDEVGFIPNGNRTYYKGRSQPPFYSLMVGLLAEEKGEEVLKDYLNPLEKEYQFWMSGFEKVIKKEDSAVNKVVRLPNGSILNRYYDKFDSPRPESYREDVETAKEAEERPVKEVYRHLRSGAESGWDYSSRWFADGENLSTIETTDIIPVDLNSLLYNLEMTLARAHQVSENKEQADIYTQKAQERQRAIIEYCWNEETGMFTDYNFKKQRQTNIPSLATMFPLFFQIATPKQAQQVAQVIESQFLKSGGVVTTLQHTGQQWDAPNGWAPLQWITIQGLRNYTKDKLANTIKQRWINLNIKVYKNTGKMVEKYNVMDMDLEAGGGEYPVQDGFGWTNGVLLKLLEE